MKTAAVLALLLLVAGCANKLEITACDGPVVPVNSADWQPSPAELAALEQAVR